MTDAETVATAVKLAGKSTSIQLLIIGEKMMTQTMPIEKFHNIFGVGDKLDRAKYRALRYTTANCKRATFLFSSHPKRERDREAH